MIASNGMDLNAWRPKPSNQAGRTRNAGGITGPYDGTRRAAGGAIVPGTNPGRAQSQQSPYANSTAYGQPVSNTPNVQGGQSYQAYAPKPSAPGRTNRYDGAGWAADGSRIQGQAPPAQDPFGASQTYGQQAGFQQQMPSFQFTGGTDWMGNQYTDPNAMMAQTGAMAQALNQQRQGMLGQGQFGSLNPQMAYNQGMEMLQQGWQNPFAAPPAFQQFQDPGNNIRDLMQGPPQSSRYGLGLTEGAIVPRDMRDADGDGVVDYYQSGPGMPDARMTGGKPETPEVRGDGFTYPGQAQPAQDQQSPWPSQGVRPARRDNAVESLYRDGTARPAANHHVTIVNPATGETDILDVYHQRLREGSGWQFQDPLDQQQFGSRRTTRPGPGQAEPAQDPYGSSTPYTPVARPSNRPPPTAEEFRQQQAEIKQKQAVNDLYRRANLQPGASTDELMLGLINNSRGGTLVRPEEMAGLPEDIRGAVSQYQDLDAIYQSLARSRDPVHQRRAQDAGAALEQLRGRLNERAQTSQALQRDYGMSPVEAGEWVNREMPMPDQAATARGLQQKQNAYQEQARTASLDRRAKQEMEAAKPKAPSATDQWNRIRATTNTQTKPLSPAHLRVYQAMVDEQRKARGMGDTWEASGSPIANYGRARNARQGAGIR